MAIEPIFPGCLIVRGFPKGSELDVLDDFAALVNRLMGVELPHIPVRMNTTLSAEGMQILLDYRQKFGAGPDGFIAPICPPDARRISLFLERSTADIRQTKPVLKNEVASRIRANHRADAELILSRYGVDLGLGGIRDDTTRVIHPLRVIEDILASVDREISYQLLIRFIGSEAGSNRKRRGLPVSLAARAYNKIPKERRIARLDRWLRPLVSGGS